MKNPGYPIRISRISSGRNENETVKIYTVVSRVLTSIYNLITSLDTIYLTALKILLGDYVPDT